MVSGPAFCWLGGSRMMESIPWLLFCPGLLLPSHPTAIVSPSSSRTVTPASSLQGQMQWLLSKKCNQKGLRPFLSRACGQSQASVPGLPSVLGPFSLLWMFVALS